MKPDFKLRIKPTSAARSLVMRDTIVQRNQQLDEAVEWCRENNKRGWAACNSGLFPLIKDRRTINKRLDGDVITGKEKEYCTILTDEEEETVVCHAKNMSCYLQRQRANRADGSKRGG